MEFFLDNKVMVHMDNNMDNNMDNMEVGDHSKEEHNIKVVKVLLQKNHPSQKYHLCLHNHQ